MRLDRFVMTHAVPAVVGVVLACGATTPCRAAAAEPAAATNAVVVVRPATNSPDAAYDQMELLAEVLLHVKKHFVEDRSYEDITSRALDGMLRSMDDYSAFLNEQAYEDVKDDTEGHYGGIGITIGMKNGALTVIAPIEDTPAYRAGLQSGDRILAIDGAKTEGFTLRQAVEKLRGETGSKVVLRIGPAAEGDERDVELVRALIEVPCVKGARLVRDGIGYLRITQFSRPAAAELKKGIDDLLGKGMQALVLDLRGNPGGLLTSAIEVAELFLRKGQLIVTTKGREGVFPAKENKAGGSVHHTDFPIVILVNKGSASASEIVAGALQDQKRAVLVGETTFGKGSVQSVIKLRADERTAIRLTTARYYTPSGRMIHGKGIDPDLPVAITAEEWRDVQTARARRENPEAFPKGKGDDDEPEVADRQLDRAVDLLHAITIFKAGQSARR